MSTRKSQESILLNGLPGKEGFLFYGGHSEPFYQAAPGVLGLLEARRVVDRWKPRTVTWLDHSEHFFDHVLHEFEGESYFEPVRREICEIQDAVATLEVKNKFLFLYLRILARELEKAEVMRSSRQKANRLIASSSGPLPETISLGGPWNVRYRKAPGVYADALMSLPTNWELAEGIDNYAGWMRFTRILNVPEKSRGRRLTLRFHGVDYFADVWVNGHYAVGHEGCFGPFEFDITPLVRFGADNIIRLGVSSPNEPSGSGTGVTSGWDDFSPGSWFPNRKTLIKGTLGHHDAKRGGAWNSLTSQDGNSGGVWNDAEIRVHNSIHFPLMGVKVATVSTALSRSGSIAAKVRFDVQVANSSVEPAMATVRMLVQPANFEGASHEIVHEIVLSPGETGISFEEDLTPVALWNPCDQGFPHLYKVSCYLESGGDVHDEVTVETGFRTLAVSPIGESEGPDGAFVVNGAELFVRGTNLLPTYWLSEYTEERIEKDFKMLLAAGFNAVLVHDLVLPKSFYQAANRRGFIVVQMFPLQWSYDQTPQFALRAAAQVEEMAEFLFNEPCVVSYEVHNEPDMRIGADVDNRIMDFELHSVLREADPGRWATTFSGGNHAYPGQFYPLRDDNSFETLPGRFLEEELHGRRISRHRNMPTEFGLQAMPNVELFRELLQEERVGDVLARIRRDPKWLAAGGEPLAEAERTIEAAKQLLGGGRWDEALRNFDWTLAWGLGALIPRIRELEQHGPARGSEAETELISLKLAELLLDVLHYGAFKGENFWFGLWKPEPTLEGFVESSQNRQYRLQKHAIETYLNAGATGPLVGYFSFMFRDPDRQAPTWGVVDADWVPKKAYRAFIESNQPVRASLPQALRKCVKLPGDSWFRADRSDVLWREKPWAGGELIVTNDTGAALEQAVVKIWLEDEQGTPIPFADASGDVQDGCRLTVNLEPHGGFVLFERLTDEADAAFDAVVPSGMPAGRYFLKVGLTPAGGETLAANSYEFYLPDTELLDLKDMPWDELGQLLYGPPGAEGFHFWGGGIEYRAEAGVKGLVSGFREAQEAGIDLGEVVQGEHLFRHILHELRECVPGQDLWREIWTIRSEIISPSEKARVILQYLQIFVGRAEEYLPQSRRPPSKLKPVTRQSTKHKRTHRR